MYHVYIYIYITNCIYILYTYTYIHINLYPGRIGFVSISATLSHGFLKRDCKVIDSENLEADNALMESGMDSLSGDLAGISLGASWCILGHRGRSGVGSFT